MTSEILQIRARFQWRPQINNEVLATIEKLVADSDSKPDMLLIGKLLVVDKLHD